MEVSKTELFSEYNRRHISDLQGENILTDEYLEFRASKLFGVNGLESPYITKYQKYLQIAGGFGEVGYGTENHIPVFNCVFYALKDSKLDLLKYYLSKVDYLHLNSDSAMKLLRSNNLEGIKLVNQKFPIVEFHWDRVVNWEIYRYLIGTEGRQRVIMNGIIILRKCPIDELDNYQEILRGWNTPALRKYLAYFSALDFDLERYQKIKEVSGTDLNYEVYILDQIPEGFSDQLDFRTLCTFGCVNLLKICDWSKFSYSYSKYFGDDPANVPKSRAWETYKLLQDRAKTDNENEILHTYVYYWSWLLEYKYHKVSLLNGPLWKLYDFDFTSYGDLELMKGIIRESIFDPYKLDLLNYPQLLPIFKEHIRNMRMIAIDGFLVENWSPDLYNILSDMVKSYESIKYAPDWKTLQKQSRNKLLIRENVVPLFLETRNCWVREQGLS